MFIIFFHFSKGVSPKEGKNQRCELGRALSGGRVVFMWRMEWVSSIGTQRSARKPTAVAQARNSQDFNHDIDNTEALLREELRIFKEGKG